MERMKGLPQLPKMSKRPRPLKVPRNVVRPTGPRIYHLQRKNRPFGIGPGEPPPGFVTPRTSTSEWRYYWAICKLMKDPTDCRKPPFSGGEKWSYQAVADATFTRSVGSQVLDFTVADPNGQIVGIRIQTERYHLMAGAVQQAKDHFLKIRAKSVDRIIDLFDQYSIGDPTGEATIKQVARALRGEQEPDPLRLGTAQRARPY